MCIIICILVKALVVVKFKGKFNRFCQIPLATSPAVGKFRGFDFSKVIVLHMNR